MTDTIAAGDHRVGTGDRTLTVIGLGSCVAVILYDSESQIGGLAHVLLPDPSFSTAPERRMRFASTAVPDLVQEMERAGATRDRMRARLVGGASMFQELLGSDHQNIGERNVLAARTALEEGGIEIIGEDVGGDFGRTVRFDLKKGEVRVKSSRTDIDVVV